MSGEVWGSLSGIHEENPKMDRDSQVKEKLIEPLGSHVLACRLFDRGAFSVNLKCNFGFSTPKTQMTSAGIWLSRPCNRRRL